MIFFRRRKNSDARKKNEPKKFRRSAFHIGVNIFVGIFEVVIVLLLLALGFMQTSTFREILRKKLVETVNESISDGEFFLDEIDGTILTTIELKNFGVVQNGDTVFYARKFKSSVALLPILTKKILIREISLEKPRIKYEESAPGKWNLNEIFASGKSQTDTLDVRENSETESNFPFVVELADFSIRDGEFTFRDFEHLESDSVYRFANFNDLRLSRINLTLNAIANISKKDFYVALKNFSFDDNLEPFALNKLSALFHVTPDFTEVKKLTLETDSTDVTVSARLDSFSPFGNLRFAENLPAKVFVKADNFDFCDLNTFLPALDFLHGKIKTELDAEGKYGDLKIKKLRLGLGKTELALDGKLSNLHDAEKLFIDAQIKGNVDYDEVENLLAGLELPAYDNLELDNVSIKYSGEPLKFDSEIYAEIDTARIRAEAFMDLTDAEKISYDYSLETEALNLREIIGEQTKLNLYARTQGENFDFETMKNSLKLHLTNSSFANNEISYLDLTSSSDNGVFSLALNASVNGAKINTGAHLDANAPHESFDLRGKFSNLDLSRFFNGDTALASDMNFALSVSAENFSNANISADAEIDFDSTVFRGSKDLSGKKFSLSVWGDSLSKHIDLKTALVDAEISGNFDYEILPSLFAEQFGRALEIVNKNITDKITATPETETAASKNYGNTELHYNLIFNPTDIWAKILNVKALTIAGYSFGNLISDENKFRFKNNSYFSDFIYIDDENVLYGDNVDFKIDLRNSNRANDIDSLTISSSVKGERILAGTEFTKASADILLDGKKVYLNFASVIDSTFEVRTASELFALENTDEIKFDRLSVASKGVTWQNRKPLKLSVARGNINFDDFSLYNDSSAIVVTGNLSLDERAESDLKLKMDAVPIRTFDKMFFEKPLGFNGTLFLETELSGYSVAPEIRSKFTCLGFSYDKIRLGDLFFDGRYRNSVSEIELKLLNRKLIKNELVLSVKGSVEKSLFGENKSGGNVDLHFATADLNLSALSALSDDFGNIRGKLNADVKITGDPDNPSYYGFAELENGRFYVTANGLDYLAGGKMKFDDKLLTIEKLYLKNDAASGFNGEIDLSGKISLDKYNFGILNLELNGGLGLLSEKTKFINPNFYGNLYVETGDKWKFTYKNDKAYLDGTLKIVDADITIAPASGGETVDLSDIDYEYLTDSTQTAENKAQELLEKYIRAQLQANENSDDKEEETNLFNYNLTFDIVNRATLNFVFSKVANQKLKAIIDGSIRISSIDNNKVVQGEFRLLPGSRLDFFRSFDATGAIRFERELLNPYLDITAIYKGVHYKNVQTEGIAEEDVAVKIKLKGFLKDLGENLTANKSNIAVYIGKKNIDNNIPDPKLDASDAMTFILFGKFNDDLTSSEQYKFSNELTSTTTAMLGTVMGVFLNSAMGDLVNDVDISKTQTRTKVMLKGRLGRFYYSIGGSQEVFQDIAQANWKVEYFFNKNLSLRVERREPLTGYLSNTQMTDEIGIKYKVSF